MSSSSENDEDATWHDSPIPEGTVTARLRARAVRSVGRKWYDTGAGAWNPAPGAGSGH